MSMMAREDEAGIVRPLPRRGGLVALEGWQPNPGRLRAWHYLPGRARGPAPLVVVLHGCRQNAADYAEGAGWIALARRNGLALLVPEQQELNNPRLCFNWFSPFDSRRGAGEAASIHSMVEAMADRFPIDRGRTYVTGLSAGGAMASVMLATYPDVFAGGGIIAGIPYGCANGLSSAFGCMGGEGGQSDAALAGSVRRASPHEGPWPIVSVWQGADDDVVAPSNADAIARQWALLHRAGLRPDLVEEIGGYRRRVWQTRDGREVVEQYMIDGMAHGTPVDGRQGADDPYILDVGVSSAERIADFWGLLPAKAVALSA